MLQPDPERRHASAGESAFGASSAARAAGDAPAAASAIAAAAPNLMKSRRTIPTLAQFPHMACLPFFWRKPRETPGALIRPSDDAAAILATLGVSRAH